MPHDPKRSSWFCENCQRHVPLDHNCDKKQIQTAIDELIVAYKQTFGDEPDNVTGMVIRSSAVRVAAGDPYHWERSGDWKKLVWD
jgi:hypothetical protein